MLVVLARGPRREVTSENWLIPIESCIQLDRAQRATASGSARFAHPVTTPSSDPARLLQQKVGSDRGADPAVLSVIAAPFHAALPDPFRAQSRFILAFLLRHKQFTSRNY